MSERRLAAEYVRHCFEISGLKPVQKSFGNILRGTGCGLTAVCCSESTKKIEFIHDAILWSIEQFGLYYRNGFARGFDGESGQHSFENSDNCLRWMAGYSDGKAAWEEVNKIPPKEVSYECVNENTDGHVEDLLKLET